MSRRLNNINEERENHDKAETRTQNQNSILKTSFNHKSQKIKPLKDYLGNKALMGVLTKLDEKDVESRFLSWIKGTKQDLVKLEVPQQYHLEIAMFLLPDRFKSLARNTEPPIDTWSGLTQFFSTHLLGATSQMILLEKFAKDNKKALDNPVGEFDTVAMLLSKIYGSQAPLLAHLDPALDTDTASQQLINHTVEYFARTLAQNVMDPTSLKTAVLLGETNSASQLLGSLNKQRAAHTTMKTQKGTSPVIGLLETETSKQHTEKKSCIIHKGTDNHTSEECRSILTMQKKLREGHKDNSERGRDRKQDNGRGGYQPAWCSFHNMRGHKTEDCLAKRRESQQGGQQGRSNSAPPSGRGQNTNFIVATEDGRRCYCKHCAAHKPTMFSISECRHCWQHSDPRTAYEGFNCPKCKYKAQIEGRGNQPPNYQTTPPPQQQPPQEQSGQSP